MGRKTSPHNMEASDREKVAYQVFIEILAYQLASPVRWIETQNQLLKRTPRVSRFVEIGPRTTLATIAKRSAAKYYASYAPSQWSSLQFLGYQDNKTEISYQYSDVASAKSQTPNSQPLANTSPPVAMSEKQEPVPRSTRVIPKGDKPLMARHIVLALTAQKLRRPFDQVSMEKSIRELSAGKSTLQNELIGDIVTEFGKVPDGVEDMALVTLAGELQGSFRGRCGTQMSALVSRFISSKMPAGLNEGAIHQYLHDRWGLTKSHSQIPLCFATTIEPPTRLSNVEAAQKFLDELVSRYSRFDGIVIEVSAHKVDNESGMTPSSVDDSASLKAFKQEQKNFHTEMHRLLTQYMGVPDDTDTRATEDMASSNIEEKLKVMQAEYDDHFVESIRPIFNLAQSRYYDSWWNWGREDLIHWVDELLRGFSQVNLLRMDHRLRMILNRWDNTCTDIIAATLDTAICGLFRGPSTTDVSEIRSILHSILDLGTLAHAGDPLFVFSHPPLRPTTTISNTGRMEYVEVPRQNRSYVDVIRQGIKTTPQGETMVPFVHIRHREHDGDWQYDSQATDLFHETLDTGIAAGLSYSGKTVLVTGAGPDSIGAHVVQGLLSGGARVIVTTSRAISESSKFFQQMYRTYGARGSSLTVLPMNQASKTDCEALIEHIYGASPGQDCDIDYVVPFAAIPQTGEPESLGSRQELALRAMLVNVLRLVGCVQAEKRKRRIGTRPTMFVLPMSCNEGHFGGDGLYGESKIGLKTLFNRFHSEGWSKYITVCGAVIGWTRGTGLMRSSNMIAEEMEKLGLLTFSQPEMAFNILALMTPGMSELAEDSPIFADLTGGFEGIWNIKAQIATARKAVSDKLQLQTALTEEEERHREVLYGGLREVAQIQVHRRRANPSLRLPSLSSREQLISSLPNLEGMVDLSTTVVVVGYSELGPWGNARTRWEMEHQAKFTLEGYLEMAWTMGLVKHVDGTLNGEPYVGWVDTETETPVEDDQIPSKYHERIMTNAGLRLIEPLGVNGYNPSKKEYLHEVAVENDLPSFESSRSDAEAFKLRHGKHITIQPIPGSDNCRVSIKKGAVLMIPKTVPFSQVVAGGIPTGWEPSQYGIPDEIVQQVDVTTLYALCCVSEALLSAGIEDPYELYQHIHVSELANCLGTGGGPLKIIQAMYRDRFLDRQVRGDIILEHFLNTMGAWVNMLLLSGTGPLKTPVGACATALESLDLGCDSIQTGKCKVAIVGGCDDYREELAFEFANIKATANCTEELAKGRLPSEISRPTASSRSGFAESAGCGVQILMSAKLALEMGLPIYGIVAYNQMASDQVGRSIPAPGKGVLTAARETAEARGSPLLDFTFRRTCFDEEIVEINARPAQQKSRGQSKMTEAAYDRAKELKMMDAQQRWANSIRSQDPDIAPMRAALATWGLSIDEIGVVSMHGTSTKSNEINESEVINTQMAHLGRRQGNPLLSVCQKSLTGHPKAAAGAWQLNGCIQMMQHHIVPGNRNADNIDEQLRQYQHLVYPMQTLSGVPLKATMLTSFGFGQKGAINILVAPRYLFACISQKAFEAYQTRATIRQRTTDSKFVTRLLRSSLVQVKSQPPWKESSAMKHVLLDPSSRLAPDSTATINQLAHTIKKKRAPSDTKAQEPSVIGTTNTLSNTVQSMLEMVAQKANESPSASVGVDVEDIASVNIDNETFLERNFTDLEREYCWKAANPRASFAGRWCAKEAVFKSLQTPSVGAGAAMRDIEIGSKNGVPQVILHGNAKSVAASKGLSSIEVTITHSAETAVAVALATGGHNTGSFTL